MCGSRYDQWSADHRRFGATPAAEAAAKAACRVVLRYGQLYNAWSEECGAQDAALRAWQVLVLISGLGIY